MNEKFSAYMALLLEWNTKINLTAITEPSEIVTKHFHDSLMCADSIPRGANCVDVGTGAGFPGIPLKIERQDISLTLMDALGKRVSFLREVNARLSLGVSCVRIRAEDAGKDAQYREKFDVALSRAVSRLAVLAEYCLPLVKPGGVMLAMKGQQVEDELKSAEGIIETLGGKVGGVRLYTLPGTDITHSLVTIHKISSTPCQYPRSSKKISKL
ncbi:MAG: 16S rRNA (guanine(527)-N(7))-methyltransferase RsmG [Clostridiales bacterium]|jgi:16S rRNA (guanine(527)-N(7))-methyltransferase RsmG|nr:16S rRNA (guanine(527)-N(7))-methyltransferase RsmG [Clostridiales bacterium]